MAPGMPSEHPVNNIKKYLSPPFGNNCRKISSLHGNGPQLSTFQTRRRRRRILKVRNVLFCYVDTGQAEIIYITELSALCLFITIQSSASSKCALPRHNSPPSALHRKWGVGRLILLQFPQNFSFNNVFFGLIVC